MKARTPSAAAGGATSAGTLSLVRRHVRDLLQKSPAFRELPPGKQRRLADDMVKVASLLAEPAGIRIDQVRAMSADAEKFVAKVDFPAFVGALINSVFEAVVESSIEQMKAFAELVAGVAKSLDRFVDDNASADQGHDWLASSYPDLFELDLEPGCDGKPCLRLRGGVDGKRALARVNRLPIVGGPLRSLDGDAVEKKLVPAARRLATSRQQLLATMVLMGINRIVVTDGFISARLEFAARAHR
ncbi:MAG TPA: hypothetical protein VF746_08610 [Longimicrobium sp.]|jgi:hypothetical protein